MFTKFKDYFKEKTPTNKLQYFTNDGVAYYTQDELDDNLFNAIDKDDYATFVDMIERGANINKVKEFGSYQPVPNPPGKRTRRALRNSYARSDPQGCRTGSKGKRTS